MPLPHFLILILAVILTAGLTIWAVTAMGVPPHILILSGLTAAAIARLAMPRDH